MGIDPGAKTGVAVWKGNEQEGELLYVRTIRKVTIVPRSRKHADGTIKKETDKIQGDKVFRNIIATCKHYNVEVIKLERPASGVWDRPGASKAEMKRIAQNVGENIAFSDELFRRLTERGLNVIQLPPKRGFTKWDFHMFQAAFGYKESTSEHSRDAACLARWGCVDEEGL